MGSSFQYLGLSETNTLNILNWCGVSRETLVKRKKEEIICHFLSVYVRQFPSPAEDPAPQRSTFTPAEPGDARAAPGFPEAAGPLGGCLQPSFHGFWSAKPPLHIPDQLQVTHGIKQSLEMLQRMYQRAARRGLRRVFGHYQLERWGAMLECYKVQESWSKIIVMDSQNHFG